MYPAGAHSVSSDAAVQRFEGLASLSIEEVAALAAAFRQTRHVPARFELTREGRPIAEAGVIISGWAARVRILIDGRRQFLSFLLPGDVYGLCRHSRPLAVSTVTALTDLSVAPLPAAAAGSELAEAYAISHALDEAYLLAQITRLGRFNAQERIADLLLELHERLALTGLTTNGSFDLPLTQEVLADVVGLTPVHVNRTIQLMRREGMVTWKGRRIRLPDPVALARSVGHLPARVAAVAEARPRLT